MYIPHIPQLAVCTSIQASTLRTCQQHMQALTGNMRPPGLRKWVRA